VRSKKNALIEVHTQVRLPRTFRRFCGLFAQLLQKLSVRSTNSKERMLKVRCSILLGHACIELMSAKTHRHAPADVFAPKPFRENTPPLTAECPWRHYSCAGVLMSHYIGQWQAWKRALSSMSRRLDAHGHEGVLVATPVQADAVRDQLAATTACGKQALCGTEEAFAAKFQGTGSTAGQPLRQGPVLCRLSKAR